MPKNLLRVQTRLFDLFLIGAFASIGAPIVMTSADLYSNLTRGISVNFLFSVAMFFIVYVYSLVATYILVGFTWFTATLLNRKAVNVFYVSIVYLLVLLGWVYFDPEPIVPIGFMAMMACPNAIVFCFFAYFRSQFSVNKIAS